MTRGRRLENRASAKGTLYATIVCPARASIGRRYRTCQSPAVPGFDATQDQTVRLFADGIPRLVRELVIDESVLLVIAGNIEGVMDWFGSENDASAGRLWLHENNVRQTFELLRWGMEQAGLPTSVEPIQASVLQRAGPQVLFLSADDFQFPADLGEVLREPLHGSNSIHELIRWFSSHWQDDPLSVLLPASQAELTAKCPHLREREIKEQLLRVRYAFRRAVGVLLEAMASWLDLPKVELVSCLKPQVGDSFHVRSDGAAIPTRHDLFTADVPGSPPCELAEASILALTTPLPSRPEPVLLRALGHKPNRRAERRSIAGVRQPPLTMDSVVVLDLREGLTIGDLAFLRRLNRDLPSATHGRCVLAMGPRGDIIACGTQEHAERFPTRILPQAFAKLLSRRVFGVETAQIHAFGFPDTTRFWYSLLAAGGQTPLDQTWPSQSLAAAGWLLAEAKGVALLTAMIPPVVCGRVQWAPASVSILDSAFGGTAEFELKGGGEVVIMPGLGEGTATDVFSRLMRCPDATILAASGEGPAFADIWTKLSVCQQLARDVLEPVELAQAEAEFLSSAGLATRTHRTVRRS